MSYCPPNVTFYTVWYEKGVSVCFLDTFCAFLLGSAMLIFGNAELWMYSRYGSILDRRLLSHPPLLYYGHLLCNVLLVMLSIVWLLVRYETSLQIYGYNILHCTVDSYCWLMSLLLIVLERNFDLPSTPARGHSVFLNIFWAASFALETLMVFNFNGQLWYFVLHNPAERALLVIFILKLILLASNFLIGMFAPGMVSTVIRGQFEYKQLTESSSKDNNAGTAESNIPLIFVLPLYGSNEDGVVSNHVNDLDRRSLNDILNYSNLLVEFRGRRRENCRCNRYTNVLPYDFNRVVLKDRSFGPNSYINASFVAVPVGELDEVLYYIATQGPLPNTVDHFWQMVWEQKVPTIIMLTDLFESGLPKCYQYWPDVNESLESKCLLISCIREEQLDKSVMREFSIIHVPTQQELTTTQLHFKGWPDHGAPRKPQHFLEFMALVNAARPESAVGMVSHDGSRSSRSPITIVHCSAGIGRTGVYVMVETLMKLLDANLPIRPLEIIRLLRNQRVGMIQTEEQLKFVCDVVLTYGSKRPRTSDK
ncbi:unnamed protein product [Soboliphyme baturini]|uniref:Protein-tyrosine-phosphatase n=1 Tax=Soboliphyme baturini TaxID=241478 RepID=A0A183IS64_9BILA|nr:unnamed protein product [Soboliphyme baturini]